MWLDTEHNLASIIIELTQQIHVSELHLCKALIPIDFDIYL
jgi:hypothetical protein